ncbi:lytic polysaccharide monooxygenase [Actinoplanes sp. NPDC049265]|uniref:lytic polysaccharide monooxygenase n=1 Tax=Actinoplanes sp. NPDC049265 TaxID=3363902 RepID=UPI003720DDCE
MRRALTYPLVALGAAASTIVVASPALAHGYVSSPPSRQALCATGAVADCGQIQFEPQSVEGGKGLKSCDGGLGQFSVLNDNGRRWPAKSVSGKVTFTWVMTARHRTSNWEYFIGGKKIATVDGGNAQPDAVVNHTVDVSAFPGRQTVLAVWNIGDTANAFYSCVDLNVGGGGGTAPSTPSSPPPATKPPATKPPAQETTKPPAQETTKPAQPPVKKGDWAANVTYKTGDKVTFKGQTYQCRQGHTSLSSWEPSIYTLALWLPL